MRTIIFICVCYVAFVAKYIPIIKNKKINLKP